jgi:EmrB/QacA subfamily drug resistance transporter
MSATPEDLFARYGPAYRWLVTGFGLAGAFAMVLSATIANVAVPHVMGAFGIGQDQAQWMATAFITAMTVSQLLNHWMVEAFGERGAYTATICVFLVGTAIGWLSPSLEVLVIGRLLQGFAAGVAIPLVMVTMFQVFPPDRRGLAMGIFGSGVVLAPALGPAVGGMAIDTFDWRAIFVMPVPFCVVGLLGGLVFMPTRAARGRLPPFDWPGYLLLAAALFLLMTSAANGVRFGWGSNRIVGGFAGGIACTVAFVWWQLRSKAPLLDFSLWRNQRFTDQAPGGKHRP